jgi:zinc protease
MLASSFSVTAQAPQGQVATQPAGHAPVASAAQVHTFTLANGMSLWVKPDRRAPTAVHMVWLRVGSMDEVDGSSGVAHVLEHMLFKGTPTLAPGEFSRRVAALGGRENAFTARDYTGYFQQIPSGQLEAVMRLEADRFANNQWPDSEFIKELEVVKEERRLRTEDNPRAQLHEMLSATALTASPYRRPIVGWMSDLEAMTAQDARDFYRKWYSWSWWRAMWTRCKSRLWPRSITPTSRPVLSLIANPATSPRSKACAAWSSRPRPSNRM